MRDVIGHPDFQGGLGTFFRSKLALMRGAAVLTTGVGSGIGGLMALEAAKHRAKAVIVWDLNGEIVEQTVVEILDLVAREAAILPCAPCASAYAVDATSDEQVDATTKTVLEEYGWVDILVSNVGVLVGKPFLETTQARIEHSSQASTLTHYCAMRHFLSGTIKHNRGSVVMTAPVIGLVGVSW